MGDLPKGSQPDRNRTTARGAPKHLIKQGSQNPLGGSLKVVTRAHVVVSHAKKQVGSRAKAQAGRHMEGLPWGVGSFPADGSSDGQTYSFGNNKLEKEFLIGKCLCLEKEIFQKIKATEEEKQPTVPSRPLGWDPSPMQCLPARKLGGASAQAASAPAAPAATLAFSGSPRLLPPLQPGRKSTCHLPSGARDPPSVAGCLGRGSRGRGMDTCVT